MIAYCDYIAHLITHIADKDSQDLILDVSRPKYDLASDGSLASTKKTMTVIDLNGKKYKITVEEQ